MTNTKETLYIEKEEQLRYMLIKLENKLNKNKYIILKIIIIITLLSADLVISTGIPNINFYIIIFMSILLLILNSLSKEHRILCYNKQEVIIYIAIFIIASFLIITSNDIINIIHSIKLFLIFIYIYPVIRRFYTNYEIISFLKINLLINFFLIILGLFGISIASRLTGVMRGSNFLNYAGSLYKVGLILVPYLIWDLVKSKKNKIRTVLILCICGYIMFFDGSRTGMLSLIIICLTYITFFFIQIFHTKKLSINFAAKIFIVIFILGILFYQNYNVIKYSNSFLRVSNTINLFLNSDLTEFLLTGDAIRGEMILDSIEKIKNNNLFWGDGFQTTKTRGVVIHNAYLQIFADLGIIPAFFLILMVVYPIFKGFNNKHINNCYMVPSVVCLILFSFSLLLHPFSVQVSDWAFYIIPLSIIIRNEKDIDK